MHIFNQNLHDQYSLPISEFNLSSSKYSCPHLRKFAFFPPQFSLLFGIHIIPRLLPFILMRASFSFVITDEHIHLKM